MKANNFSDLIKHIRKNILTEGYNELQIQVFNDGIYFSLYEMFDIQIAVEKDKVYSEDFKEYEEKWLPRLKVEFLKNDLTTEELKEIYKICEYLEENMDTVLTIL